MEPDKGISAKSDKTTLGLTERGKAVMSTLMDRDDLFSTEGAAFKSVVALALRLGLEPSEVSQGYDTKWGIGGQMSDLVEFVAWYCNTSLPVRTAERLAEAALDHISEAADLKSSIVEIFELQDET